MAVAVESYNPAWPAHFEIIKLELQSHLASINILSIEHVGSTSVPTLAANPIIDIDVIVATHEDVQPVIKALVANANFTDLGELGITYQHALKDLSQPPNSNIYISVHGALQTRNHLGVRDTLRGHPVLRDEYGAFKTQLAARGMNIVDYGEAKSGIMQKNLRASGLLSDEELKEMEEANKRIERIGAIKTQRLLLREFVLTDVDGYFGLESQAEVVRYQTFGPLSRDEARQCVANVIKNSSAVPRTHFELAVEFGGVFVGRVGASVKRIAEESGADLHPHADLWFSFVPKYQGNGFASEALQAFITLLGSPLELEIECDPRNKGSWKLAERLGFARVSLTERVYECKGEWVDSLVYRKSI